MKKNIKKKKNKILIAFYALSISALLSVLIAISAFFGVLYFGGAQPDMDALAQNYTNLTIYDSNNSQIDAKKSNSYAEYQEIPQILSNAFIAVEDKRFLSHHGVDYVRIGGALINNIKGNRTQGASTITQQLVKNTYLSSEQTFSRKFKEMQTAIKLERMLTKDEIMEYYLNMLYFGSGEYGVKNASARFFGKELNQLNALECAMLAGIVKSPTKYNPINNYDNSITRAKVVLRLMRDQSMIDENIYNSYIDRDIIIKNDVIENDQANYYLNNAINEACSILGVSEKFLRQKGYKIYTHFDAPAQLQLCSTVLSNSYYQDDSVNGIGIVCDNVNRGIKAFASRKKINVFEYRRQPGSAIKPLACYAPALDQGLISPSTRILDEPTSFGTDYAPSNYKGRYYGWTSIEDCVAKSLNVPAVKIMQQLGCDTSVDYLNKMNIQLDEHDKNLSLALGGSTHGLNMIELLGGYATLANYGLYKSPTFIRKIEDNKGNIVYDSNLNSVMRIFDEQSCYLMTDMLVKCSQSGTAKKLNSLNFQVACKTGTVSMQNKDFNSDIYSVGYTADNTFLFWQGDSSLKSSSTGGGATTLMFKNYLNSYYNNYNTPNNFAIPDGIKEIYIDKYFYESKNEIVSASVNAPKNTVIKALFSQKCLPILKDSTYDRIAIDDLQFNQNSNNLTINFQFNPKLGYKIYKRDFAKGEYLLYDIKNNQGTADIKIDLDKFFGNRITVIPYYIDDENKEIIGIPQKYYSNSLISGLYN